MHNANAAAGTSSLSGSRRVIPPQDKLRKLVKEWDKDGDGLISFPEFTRALKTCALAISNHLEPSRSLLEPARRFALRRFALQRAARLCSCTERFFLAREHPPG